MGLDRASFDSGLRGARGALDVFNRGLAVLGLGFSLGQAKAFIGSLTEMAQSLNSQSEALGVSTDFLQGWQVAAREAGVDAEGASGALDKFLKHLADSGK